MLKARGTTGEGAHALIIGLTLSELDELRAGGSIRSMLGDIGADADVFLFAGKDEEDMRQMLLRANLIANAPPSNDDTARPVDGSLP